MCSHWILFRSNTNRKHTFWWRCRCTRQRLTIDKTAQTKNKQQNFFFKKNIKNTLNSTEKQRTTSQPRVDSPSCNGTDSRSTTRPVQARQPAPVRSRRYTPCGPRRSLARPGSWTDDSTCVCVWTNGVWAKRICIFFVFLCFSLRWLIGTCFAFVGTVR